MLPLTRNDSSKWCFCEPMWPTKKAVLGSWTHGKVPAISGIFWANYRDLSRGQPDMVVFSKGNLQNSLHSDVGMKGNRSGPSELWKKLQLTPHLEKWIRRKTLSRRFFLRVFFKVSRSLVGWLVGVFFLGWFFWKTRGWYLICTSNHKFYNPFLPCFLVSFSWLHHFLNKRRRVGVTVLEINMGHNSLEIWFR